METAKNGRMGGARAKEDAIIIPTLTNEQLDWSSKESKTLLSCTSAQRFEGERLSS